MKIRFTLIALLLLFLAYCGGYLYLRSARTERWDKNGKLYVLFPKEPKLLYYLYRPVSLIDGKVTGMQFHIGPHQD